MKTLAAFFFITAESFGQANMVSNPGFEHQTSCPTSYNQITYAVDWTGVPGCMSISDVADYFHTCSTTLGFSPPVIGTGWQQTHSGNAFCGISTSSTVVANCHEYCQNKLLDSLVPGQQYTVSFYANLSGGGYFSLASNKLGALLTTYQVGNTAIFPSVNFAHVYTDSVITDTAGWFFVSGSFIADSAYTYMTIGNFFDDAHTIRQPLNGNATYAWYYIDDVSLSMEDPNGVYANQKDRSLSLYPNPGNGNFTLRFNDPIHNRDMKVKIMDASGKTVYESASAVNSGNELTLDPDLETGIYFILITGVENFWKQKLAVVK